MGLGRFSSVLFLSPLMPIPTWLRLFLSAEASGRLRSAKYAVRTKIYERDLQAVSGLVCSIINRPGHTEEVEAEEDEDIGLVG